MGMGGFVPIRENSLEKIKAGSQRKAVAGKARKFAVAGRRAARIFFVDAPPCPAGRPP